MDEEMTGLFRCRNCGAVLEEKVDVARSVSWAIKDITENLGGDGITSVFHRTSLPDLSNLPTIDPESLRGHAKWVKDKELKFIIVDDENNSHEEPAICCTHCKAKISQSDFDSWVWNFCPVCGFKMEDATNG